VSVGRLPPGLVLDPSSGVISGAPTEAGLFSFTVAATDNGAPAPQIATKNLSIRIIGSADLALSIAAPKPSQQSKPLTFTITVQNLGPTNATGLVVTDTLPSASQFVSVVASQGSCTTPPVGSTGTMLCRLGDLADGGTATISLTVKPTLKKGTISDTATVVPDTNTIDPIAANNSAAAEVQIK